MVLASPPKTGKSSFATDLAFAGLAGQPIGDLIHPVAPMRVLWWSTDEVLDEIMERFEEHPISTLGESLANIHVISKEDAIGLHNKNEVKGIAEFFKPDFIIVDSLRGILDSSGFDENHSAAGEFSSWLHKFCNQFNTGGLLLHHLNKKKEAFGTNRVSGHGGIVSNSSGVMLMRDKKESLEIDTNKVLMVTGRGIAPFKYHINLMHSSEWLEHGSCFDYVGEIEGDNTTSASDVEKVRQFLMSNFGTPHDANTISNGTGVKYHTTRQALDRMVTNGEINKIKPDIPTSKHHKLKWFYGYGELSMTCSIDNSQQHTSVDDIKEGGIDLYQSSSNPYISISPTMLQHENSCSNDEIEDSVIENEDLSMLQPPTPIPDLCTNDDDGVEDEDDDYKIEKPTEIGQMCILHPRAANDLEEYVKVPMVLIGLGEEDGVGKFNRLSFHLQFKDHEKYAGSHQLDWHIDDFIRINSKEEIDVVYSKAQQQRKNKPKKVLGMSADYEPTQEPRKSKKLLT
ncbi:AAA family ATPase [Chroococcidiopsis sp. CCNUC1]|uniref:AAA family ATPase n=1 Tax=Chroococcidiopsis sp. CCNUC1 TaxID=2653189 RepID=UPI00201FFE43|nr:AAA family ATPase [Chroococcidiopsis sp. CCNUC1]URD50735.1 AAA family ATPase [Chroococcidiopsis sp. CCNUC1]